MVKESVALTRFPQVHRAVLDQEALIEQANAIVAGLQHLPGDLTPGQASEAESHLVSCCRDLDPRGLRIAANRVVEVVAPEVADAHDARHLARIEDEARRTRHLRFSEDHHGSVVIRGSLPLADGHHLRTLVDAIANRCDPGADGHSDDEGQLSISREARRADALIELARIAAATGTVPSNGGGRPRLIVTVSLERLAEHTGRAELFETDQAISIHHARGLACDADITPVLTRSDGMPLQLGRTRRLVSPHLRTALTLRDRGCSFPGCSVRAVACEAHHIRP